MTETRKIIKNAAECTLCGDVIESTFRHDYKVCKCGNVMVDGGKDYIRRGVTKDWETLVDRSEFADE